MNAKSITLKFPLPSLIYTDLFDLQVTVYIRVIFLKIGEIDTLKEKYAADVFIQARWREPALDGQTHLVSGSKGALDGGFSSSPVEFKK